MMKRILTFLLLLLLFVPSMSWAHRMVASTTDQYVYFIGVDSTDFHTREAGLSSFTVYYSINGGAATAMTTPTVNETDSSNMPGVYELLIDEAGMTTLTAGDDTHELALHITHAGMDPVTRIVEIYRPETTAGQTLTVASGVGTANATQISGDSTAADNAELAFDGTGYGFTGCTMPTVTTLTGHTVQTGDSYARLGAPVGASISADIQTVDGVVDAVLLDTGTDGVALADGVITAAKLGADCITNAKIADDAIGAENIATDALAADGLAADAIAEINATVDTALSDINLDHLMKTAVANNADMTVEVADGTVLSNIMSSSSDTSTYVVADDSLQGISEGAAGGGATAQEVWEYGTRYLTALDEDDTTIDLDGSTVGDVTNAINVDQIEGADATDTINAQVDTALTDIKLDHLIAVADSDDVVDSSIIAKMAASDNDWSGYDSSTDSLEALRDRGDAAWTTGAGGSPPTTLQNTTIATLATQTSFTLTAGSTDDDAYNGCIAVVEDSATATQKCVGRVSDYTGSSKTVTLEADPGVFTMAVGDTIDIIAVEKTWTASTRTLSATQTFDITGNLYGGITGAVGSVTGNVGGNVVGNVTGTIGGLESAAAATVNAACDQAFSDYDPPTRAELTTDKTSIITEIDANETKIDTVDTVVDAVLLDTGELQTDLTDGGRLDLLIDAILADTGTDGVVLANDAITAAKIAADAIGASELAANAATEIIDNFETQSQADPTGFHVNVLEVGGTSQTANDNGADINAIKTKTDNLPADPADDSDLDSQLSTIDTVVDAIKVKTDRMRN